MKNIKVLGDKVLVKTETERVSRGGVFHKMEVKPTKGEVVLTGEEVHKITIGDLVVFGEYAGFETNLDGEKYLVLEEKDIFLITNK